MPIFTAMLVVYLTYYFVRWKAEFAAILEHVILIFLCIATMLEWKGPV